MLTQEKLKELLNYDPATGLFNWKVNKGSTARIGQPIICINKVGYVVVCIDYKRYTCHRLAWLYQKGLFPKYEIDHKDGIRSNNKWNNLREVEPYHNHQNQKIYTSNTSGFKGITYIKGKNTWSARIQIKGKVTTIGYFKTAEEAALARCKFEDNCPEWSHDLREQNRVRLRELGYQI